MNTKTKTIFLMAGEASGDFLGAELVQQLKKMDPTIEFIGMGGVQMKNAGVEILIDSDELAVLGGLEIITSFHKIWRASRIIKQQFKNHKPDLVIPIDYPGFNLYISKCAHRAGCKVLYYVSPSIWAWHYGRIKTIKKNIDHMAVLFPFEKDIYQKENMPATFVGHPSLATVKPSISKEAAYQKYQLNPDELVIGLLPGSRKQEIKRLLPPIIEASHLLKKQHPHAQFILPIASSLKKETLQPHLPDHFKLIERDRFDALQLCDAAICASGTATLELALLKIPMVMVYQLNPITFAIAWRVKKVPYVCICNIIAGKEIIPEILQKNLNANNILKALLPLIENPQVRQQQIHDYEQLREKLGSEHPPELMANLARDLL